MLSKRDVEIQWGCRHQPNHLSARASRGNVDSVGERVAQHGHFADPVDDRLVDDDAIRRESIRRAGKGGAPTSMPSIERKPVVLADAWWTKCSSTLDSFAVVAVDEEVLPHTASGEPHDTITQSSRSIDRHSTCNALSGRCVSVAGDVHSSARVSRHRDDDERAELRAAGVAAAALR